MAMRPSPISSLRDDKRKAVFCTSTKNIKVSADSSSYGRGAVLLQEDGDQYRPVAYVSDSDTECNYTQIEKKKRLLKCHTEYQTGIFATVPFAKY